ncbi:MAG: hypothetical protein AAGE65_09450 [Planctomycetota bacterium]
MTPETAKLVVLGSAATAAMVWLVALLLAWRGRKPKPIEPVRQTLVGRPRQAVRDALGRAAALMMPPWDLVGGEPSYALFDVPHTGPGTSRVRVAVETDADTSDDVKITCSQEAASPSPWVAWLLVAFLAAIPIATAVAITWAWRHAQDAANDAARVQVIQLMQLGHLLWPPFLLLGFRYTIARSLRHQLQRFPATLDLIVSPGSSKPATEPTS